MAISKDFLIYLFVKLQHKGLVSDRLATVLDRSWDTHGNEIWEGTSCVTGGGRLTRFVSPSFEDDESTADRIREFGRDHLLKGESITHVRVRKRNLTWKNFINLGRSGGLYPGEYTIGSEAPADLPFFGFCPECGGDTEWAEEAVQYCTCHDED